MGRNIEIPQTYLFSERKPDYNCQSRGKHDSSYYQPTPANYNQNQQYFHDRKTKQTPSVTDYDRDKVENCGNIHSEIP